MPAVTIDVTVQNPTEANDDANNSTSSAVQGNIGGSLKGIRASYSTTALDAISEAPENIDTDEDMISQGSAAVQGEDLMFGSRGSLSIGQKNLVEPDLSEDDSENEEGGGFLGSGGSLGLMR